MISYFAGAASFLLGSAVLYTALRFIYRKLVPFLPFQNEPALRKELEQGDSRIVASVKSDTHLILWSSDKRMVSFDFCLGTEDGAPPRLVICRQSKAAVVDFINSFFRLEQEVHYVKIFDVQFEDPDQNRIFMVDDIRLVDEGYSVLSVLLSSYNCGSGGAKYLGVLRLEGDIVSSWGPGPLKAFEMTRDMNSAVLAPQDRVSVSLANGLKFAKYSIEDAVFYSDLDGDGHDELVTAFMLWSPEECHWCPHRWLVTTSEWTPSGFRSSIKICRDGRSVVSSNKYAPQTINGFIPGSVGLFGNIEPANLLRTNRDIRMCRDVVLAIYSEDGACDSWIRYLSDPSRAVNFAEVNAEDFDPHSWHGITKDETTA